MGEQVKDAAEAAAGSGAHCMSLEGWRVLSPDPLQVAATATAMAEGFEDVVEEMGFGRWTYFGDLTLRSTPISIQVYSRRSAAPEYLAVIWTNNSSQYRYAFADDLPSIMRLLGEWGATAQSAAAVQLAAAVPPKSNKEMDNPMFVPNLTGLVEKSGADGAKKIVEQLTEAARQIGEVDDSLLRRLAEIQEAIGRINP